MKKFDIKRLWLVAKWDITTNGKSSAKITLGMTLGLLLMYLAHTLSIGNIDFTPMSSEHMLAAMGEQTTIAFVIFIMVGASLIFANMKTKQSRTTFCMLPASNAEKFVARWLWSTVGFVVMFAVAFVIADFVRWLFSLVIAPHISGSVVIYSIKQQLLDSHVYTAPTANSGMVDAIATYTLSVTVFVHSCYVLGGALFRRYAGLLTTCLGIALLLTLLATDNMPFLGRAIVGNEFWYGHRLTALFVASAVFAVLSVLCYLAAWRLFRHAQVINNRLFNL